METICVTGTVLPRGEPQRPPTGPADRPEERHHLWVTRGRWIYAGVFALFALVLVRNAWMADDAFITLRTIDQFLRGQGLGFNFGERVQAYTHPLWLWVLLPAYAVSREAFYAPLLVSMAVSAGAVWIFSRRLRGSSLLRWNGCPLLP